MDDALQPPLRKTPSAGVICVGVILAANAALIVWMSGSSSSSADIPRPDPYPLQIKLLDEADQRPSQDVEKPEGATPLPSMQQTSASTRPSPLAAQGDVGDAESSTAQIPATTSQEQERQDLLAEQQSFVELKSLACRVWGPIGTDTVLNELRLLIGEVGDVIDLQKSAVTSDPDYLVYIDTDKNIDSAHRLVKELESQSVDAYVISGGELVNSVSVGVFSREDRALVQLQRVGEMGYDASVQSLVRSQIVYHLYARVPQGFETAGHSSVDCAAIASLQ